MIEKSGASNTSTWTVSPGIMGASVRDPTLIELAMPCAALPEPPAPPPPLGMEAPPPLPAPDGAPPITAPPLGITPGSDCCALESAPTARTKIARIERLRAGRAGPVAESESATTFFLCMVRCSPFIPLRLFRALMPQSGRRSDRVFH